MLTSFKRARAVVVLPGRARQQPQRRPRVGRLPALLRRRRPVRRRASASSPRSTRRSGVSANSSPAASPTGSAASGSSSAACSPKRVAIGCDRRDDRLRAVGSSAPRCSAPAPRWSTRRCSPRSATSPTRAGGPARVGIYRLWRDGGFAVGAILAGVLADAFGVTDRDLGRRRAHRRCPASSSRSACTRPTRAIRRRASLTSSGLPSRSLPRHRRDEMDAHAVKEFFESVAGDWDEIRATFYNAGVIDALADHAAIGTTSTVVDVGTGTGFVAAGLAFRRASLIGVDHSPAMLRVARENLTTLRRGECRARRRCGRRVTARRWVRRCRGRQHGAAPRRGSHRDATEMARVVKPGGWVAITDEVEHPYTWMREEQADIWLGFAERDVARFLPRRPPRRLRLRVTRHAVMHPLEDLGRGREHRHLLRLGSPRRRTAR